MRTLLFSAILFSSSFATAQPGSLDSSFGTNGVTLTKFYLGNAFGKAMAMHTDGKIVLVGGIEEYPDYYASMAQYLPNGQPDSSFGVNGKVNKRNSSGFHSVAIQSDGKILVTYYGNSSGYALMRYHKNGTVDKSFGDEGSIMIDFLESSLAIQTDGKIIVAGSISTPGGNDFAVARYKKYGKLDSSFGTNGKVYTDFGGSDNGRSVCLQADGKIVAAGWTLKIINGYSRDDFAIARYNVNGSADSSFGTNGKVTAAFDYQTVGNSVAIQPDGKIIIAGYTVGHWFSCALARYKKNGSLDLSFGDKGLKRINFGDNTNIAESVAVQPDGKIIIAGHENNTNSFALARCSEDGPLDISFDYDGKVTKAIGSNSYAKGLIIQPDGKIVVGGYAYDNGKWKFAIARYHGDATTVIVKDNYATAGKNQESNSNVANIYLSPNPVKDVLFVQGLNPLTSKTISLINNSGRMVQKITTSNSNYSFNVHHLPSGIYFIRIDDKEKITTLKFIKD